MDNTGEIIIAMFLGAILGLTLGVSMADARANRLYGESATMHHAK